MIYTTKSAPRKGDRSMFSANDCLANATPFGRKMDQSPSMITMIYTTMSSSPGVVSSAATSGISP